jgi:hypothetical protein
MGPPAGVTQQELESRLWAANSLRGPVDPADFKASIFPLLFYKRISDTWDAEHAAAEAKWGDDLDGEIEADYHRFTMPDGCHWADLRRVHENVGVAPADPRSHPAGLKSGEPDTKDRQMTMTSTSTGTISLQYEGEWREPSQPPCPTRPASTRPTPACTTLERRQCPSGSS